MDDFTDLQAMIAAIGGTASSKKKPKIAPGGTAAARPAPSKIRSENGVTDSEFVQQIIQAAQQLGGTSMAPMSAMGAPMQPPQQPPMPAQPEQGGGGLAQMLGALGGGR